MGAPPPNGSLGPTESPPRPGERGCENGALMDSFGIFLQGLLGVVAFSTLMREWRRGRAGPSHGERRGEAAGPCPASPQPGPGGGGEAAAAAEAKGSSGGSAVRPGAASTPPSCSRG